MDKLRVGVLGATGAAGLEFIRALDVHPWFNVVELYASKKSADKTLEKACSLDVSDISANIRQMKVQAIGEIDPDLDLICSALPSEVARDAEAYCAQHTPVISTASDFRYEPDVPVIITEVNAGHYPLLELQKQRGWNGWIAPGPNCTTVGLVMSLAPLYKEVGIERVAMTSSQAISGGGYGLIQLWNQQRQSLLKNGNVNLPEPLSGIEQPIDTLDIVLDGNIIGDIKGEVEKVKKETIKILGDYGGGEIYPANFLIDCQCTRVPTLRGHFESVFVETKSDCSPSDLKRIYHAFNSRVRGEFGDLPSSPRQTIVVLDRSPQPYYDANLQRGMAAVVGMINPTDLFRHGLKYQVLSNNTEKGAAKGMVQVAEYLYKIGFLKAK